MVHAFCRVALEDEKNGKPNCDRNGFVKTMDASENGVHLPWSKVLVEGAAPRKGLHGYCLHTLFL